MNIRRVLIVDSGGRGHATAWKVCQSPQLERLYVAPGNAGTEQLPKTRNVPLKATEIYALLQFALHNNVDLTIVTQDDPLALGIVDLFRTHGLLIFGPTESAMKIESSKADAKALMVKQGVQTAKYETFTGHKLALEYVRAHFAESNATLFIKASGLALGKGAYGCSDLAEAEQALGEIMGEQRVHGTAGDVVVIEEFVEGPEVSIHAFSDGNSSKLLPAAQDHKPIFDGDQGPNTGGMGTFAPVPWFNAYDVAESRVVQPILDGLRERGTPFVGVLYPGLKGLPSNPKVLEFNGRPGDPEWQVYMRLLKTDLLVIIEACLEGRLHEINIEWSPGFAACVVMASKGYPSPDYKKGVPITGIDLAEQDPRVIVFHAGTKEVGGQIVTSGGRVLGVTAVGQTLSVALHAAYRGVELIDFDGAQWRKDIGAKTLDILALS